MSVETKQYLLIGFSLVGVVAALWVLVILLKLLWQILRHLAHSTGVFGSGEAPPLDKKRAALTLVLSIVGAFVAVQVILWMGKWAEVFK